MTTKWILELVDKITAPLRTATEAAERAAGAVDGVSDAVDDLGNFSDKTSGRLEKLGKGMFLLNQIKEGVDNIRDSFNEAIEPGVRFQSAMAEVEAISGLSKDKMDLIADKARALAKAFGSDAAGATGVFSNILSQLGPELADAPNALDAMGRHAMTLSKTMNGDVKGAVSALTTAFNAYGISLDDPMNASREMEEQMNVIAKSAQIGAAEVSDIAQSLSTVGVSPKNAGVSFAETNAAIQVFGQSTIKGAEAGVALRNIVAKISAPSTVAVKMMQDLGVNMQLLQNKTLPLADRLQALVPVMHNDVLMTRLFGLENIVAAQTLIGSTEQLKTWTHEVQGSTSATDQAAIVMDTYAEKQKRMQAFVNDLKISFFEFVEPIAPAIQIVGVLVGAIVTLGTVVWSVSQIMSATAIKSAVIWVASMVKMAISAVSSSATISAAIYSIPIIGWIALAITAIGALVAYLWNKFGEVRAFFYGLWNFIKVIFTEYYRFIVNVMKAIWEVINPLNWFDKDFHFSDVWDRLSRQAVEGGKKVGRAFSDGWKEGMEDWEKSHPKEDKKEEVNKFSLNNPLTPANVEVAGGEGSVTEGYSGGGGKSSGLGGNGGVRNITMNVTMNNHFRTSGSGDDQRIINRIKQELITVMTDAVPVAG